MSLPEDATDHSAVDPVATRLDQRFDELERHIGACFEAMRADFAKVRDIVIAYLAQVSAQLDEQDRHVRSLERRVTVLEAFRKR